MQDPKDSEAGSPNPGTPTFQQRHRSPSSQGMPVDTAGKGHPKPEFQNPPDLRLGASWQGAEWLRGTSGTILTIELSKRPGSGDARL